MHPKGYKGDRAQIVRLLAFMYVVLTVVSFATLWKRFDVNFFDLQLYYKSGLSLIQRQLPYRDFPLEYPPFALVPMVVPQIVNFGRRFSRDLAFGSYVGLFFLENAIFSTAIALLLLQVKQYWQSRQHSLWTLKAYIILAIISAPILPWRYDLFPALLTLLAFGSILQGRATIAGIWLGLGILTKLYPVVLLPIFVSYYLASKKYRSLLNLLLGCLGATCVILLPLALVTQGEMLSFLKYHQLRGLQVESFAAGIICLAHILQLTKISLVLNYGAFHLVSPLADGVLKWLPLISILAFVGVISSCLIRFRREYAIAGKISADSLTTYIIAALLTFMVTSKVFSPQYIIWLLPFAPLLRPRQFWLMVAIFAMTIGIFPAAYSHLLGMQVPSVLLLNLRNFSILALLLWLLIKPQPTITKIQPLQQGGSVSV